MREREPTRSSETKESEIPQRRVVVTGMGAVTSLGLSWESTWGNLLEGKSGIKRIPELEEYRVQIAGVVSGFELEKYFGRSKDRLHRAAQFGLAASSEALEKAGLIREAGLIIKKLRLVDPKMGEKIGVIIGTGMGGATYIAEIANIIKTKGERRIPPSALLKILLERVSTVVSMEFGLKGLPFTPGAACATGSMAIHLGYNAIVLREAEIMVVGGAEATIDPIGIGLFAAARALSTQNENPQSASRPFDKKRDGFVMSEGAAILVLESLEHALNRKAPIYGELVGYAETSDAKDDVQPSGEGAVRALKLALQRAGIEPWEVDYINPHATSTPIGDKKEIEALKRVFGKALGKISISATKSSTGHLMGAAGALEALICLKAIEENIIPPTLNLVSPERFCRGLDIVGPTPEEREVKVAISNSFGFGGKNSVLVFCRYVP